MCGIIGYTGSHEALPILLQGLSALEYRGYDSAGVALVQDGSLRVTKQAGRLRLLEQRMAQGKWAARTGIGHTRWATHGAPDDRNAHPHTDCTGRLAVVHNGIIENHASLRAELADAGCTFRSDTDTEVLPHLIAAALDDEEPLTAASLARAVSTALRRVEGAFALAVVSVALPGVIVAARRAAPLLIGRADGASLLASDVAGIVAETSDVEALDDDQIAILSPDGVDVVDLDARPVSGRRFTVDWNIDQVSRGSYDHFMLKEIHEQPAALRATLGGRLSRYGRLALDKERPLGLRPLRRLLILGCGTSAHAGMAAQAALEWWTGIPVSVELASEFRYRRPIVPPGTLAVAISQSGETADTLAAAEHARALGADVLAVTNTPGSSLTRAAEMVLLTRAGPEIGVAATKTFTTQVAALHLVALWLAQETGRSSQAAIGTAMQQLLGLPDLVEQTVEELAPQTRTLADELVAHDYMMLIGRHIDLPVALEGALKLKEVSYIAADAYAAGEMKHGPIALIDQGTPVIAVVTSTDVRDKSVSNMAEVQARGAHVIAVAAAGDVDIKEHADRVLFVPAAGLAGPILGVLPLQLLSYHLAVALGRDVDKPRNLAKTVTVE